MLGGDLEVLENIWEEGHLLGLVVASIVGLMGIGLEIAKLETGKTNAIAAEKEDTLSETARTVLRISSVAGAILGLHLHTVVVGVVAEVTAEAGATADQGPHLLRDRAGALKGMREGQGAQGAAGALWPKRAHHQAVATVPPRLAAGALEIVLALLPRNTGNLNRSAMGLITVRALGGRTGMTVGAQPGTAALTPMAVALAQWMTEMMETMHHLPGEASPRRTD